MGCSQPKEFRTGLRIVGSFLKVKLYYNICGTQVPLRLPAARGLTTAMVGAASVLLAVGMYKEEREVKSEAEAPEAG